MSERPTVSEGVSLQTPSQARRQLKFVLGLFFLSLSIPLVVLFDRVYRQLENEVLFQFRGSADEIVSRVNSRIQELLVPEENRPFDEYNYYKVDQIPLQKSKGLIYSPLAEYPPKSPIPGVVGYFQINPDGTLQAPILPQLENGNAVAGLSGEDFAQRVAAVDKLYAILAGEIEIVPKGSAAARPEPQAKKANAPVDRRAAASPADKSALSEKQIAEVVAGNRFSNQQVAPERLLEDSPLLENAQKVKDLNLDSKYLAREAKSSAGAKARSDSFGLAKNQAISSQRERRKEKVDLAVSEGSYDEEASEPAPSRPIKEETLTDSLDSLFGSRSQSAPTAAPGMEHDAPPAPRPVPEPQQALKKKRTAVRILTLEGEVDPFQFKVLDADHFLFIRKVWRNGQRYLQGFVIEQAPFINELLASSYSASSMSQLATLIIGYQGVFFKRIEARNHTVTDRDIVLSRRTLNAPVDDVELLFTLSHLPSGPGAAVVNGIAYALSAIVVFFLFAFYRLGSRQIELAKERSDFVSAVSHELRTPLTSIRMYSEMLRAGWVTEEDKKKSYYDYIFRESERLSRLIANVLQFSRFSQGRAKLELKLKDAQGVLALAEERAQSQLEGSGFVLEKQFEDLRVETNAPAFVEIDEDAFVRIVINLVDNAVKFSQQSEQKAVVLSLKLTEGEAMLSVRDFGPGVPRSKMKHIFKLFYRAEDEITRSTTGTGIGLALVRELAQKMNATVDLRNQNPGAEFILRLPLRGK